MMNQTQKTSLFKGWLCDYVLKNLGVDYNESTNNRLREWQWLNNCKRKAKNWKFELGLRIILMKNQYNKEQIDYIDKFGKENDWYKKMEEEKN